jgi:protein kinase-like protein
MEKRRTVDSKLATTIVSTKDKPLRLWLWLVLCLVLLLSMTEQILSQPQGSLDSREQAKAVAVKFDLNPPQATVWRRTVEGEIHLLGPANEQVAIGLNSSEANGLRKIIVEFRVPLWSGDWVSPPEFLDVETLRKQRRFPSEGQRELGLSAWQRFQVSTRSHPVLTLALLLAFLVVPTWVVRRRRRTEPVNDSNELRVPGYIIGPQIGEGAMGTVYSAVGQDGANYALKVLRGLLSESEKFRKQFDKELQIYLRLKHPNLLRLFGFGYTSDGRTYMATELLSGDSLKDVMASGLATGALAAEVLEQIGSALDYLHQKNIVHQDVKPGNIFVGHDGVIKLLDLGIAKAGDEAGGGAGTLVYMAPEQFQHQASPRSDQYSLGLVVREMLVGRESEPSGVLSAELQAALATMLSESPESRYPDLLAAREALTELLLVHQ